MKIRMHVDGQVVTAALYDNATARDFAALLPLSLTLEDYAVIERISNLPRKLSTADAPAGMKPETGDITYYAPWGNLAIFASGNVYARGLLPLGGGHQLAGVATPWAAEGQDRAHYGLTAAAQPFTHPIHLERQSGKQSLKRLY